MKHFDMASTEFNRIHLELEKQLSDIKVSEPDSLKKHKKIQKEIQKNKKNCEKTLMANIKNGKNIVGSLEFKLLNENLKLRKKWSSWARTRGRNFEDLMVEKFEQYSKLYEHTYPYKNVISKFGFQPYDIIVFCKDRPPLLLECKASGVGLRKDKTVLEACKRRYIHYTEINKIGRIERIKSLTNLKLYFVFNEEKTQKFYFVNSDLIYKNSEHLCKKNLVLEESDYIALNHDVVTWPADIQTVLNRL